MPRVFSILPTFNEIFEKKFTHQPTTDRHDWWVRQESMRKKKLNPKTREKSLKISVLFETRWKYRTKQKKAPSIENIVERTRKKKVRIGQNKHEIQLIWYQDTVVEALEDFGDMWPKSTSGWCSHRTCNKRCLRFHLPPYYFKARFQFAARGVRCWSGIWNLWKFLPQNNETMRVWNSISPLFRPQNFSLSDGLFLTYPFSAFLFLFDISHSCLGISRLIANQKKK